MKGEGRQKLLLGGANKWGKRGLCSQCTYVRSLLRRVGVGGLRWASSSACCCVVEGVSSQVLGEGAVDGEGGVELPEAAEVVVQEGKEARASDLEQAVVVKNFITTSPLRHRQS